MTKLSMENNKSITNAPQITPWGSWEVLDDNDNYKVKKITIKPGQRLSYQKHFKREEFWIIVQGQAEVVLNDKTHHLSPGQTICIAQESLHRIGNAAGNSEDVVFIEIQRGTYFGEDDIVRIEDDYGRK